MWDVCLFVVKLSLLFGPQHAHAIIFHSLCDKVTSKFMENQQCCRNVAFHIISFNFLHWTEIIMCFNTNSNTLAHTHWYKHKRRLKTAMAQITQLIGKYNINSLHCLTFWNAKLIGFMLRSENYLPFMDGVVNVCLLDFSIKSIIRYFKCKRYFCIIK